MDIKIQVYQKTNNNKYEKFSLSDAYKYNLIILEKNEIITKENVFLSFSTNLQIFGRELWTGDKYEINNETYVVEYNSKQAKFDIKNENNLDRKGVFYILEHQGKFKNNIFN